MWGLRRLFVVWVGIGMLALLISTGVSGARGLSALPLGPVKAALAHRALGPGVGAAVVATQRDADRGQGARRVRRTGRRTANAMRRHGHGGAAAGGHRRQRSASGVARIVMRAQVARAREAGRRQGSASALAARDRQASPAGANAMYSGSYFTVPSNSVVISQATDLDGVIAFNFTLASDGDLGCPPSGSYCALNETHNFGAFAAGTTLTFNFYNNYGASEDAFTTQESPNSWSVNYAGSSVLFTAVSVSSLNTLGSAPLGLMNDPECSTPRPVNCYSGDFTHTFTDLTVPGRGEPLDLTRTYNSLTASTEGIFGYGWSSSYDMNLSFDSSGDATVHEPGGAQATFLNQGSGAFSAPGSVLGTLSQNTSTGVYTLTQRGQEVFTFTSSGKLLTEADLNGYTTTLAYNSSGQLTTVTDPAGRTLTFAYGSNGLVSSVTDPAGRVVSYGYDSSGELTSATEANGGVWKFAYGTGHLLTTMTDPRNDGSLTNTYDSQGRVTQQVDPLGRKTLFAYGAPTSGGTQTNTTTSPNGNVTQEIYSAGTLTSLTKGYGTSSAATWTYAYGTTLGVTSETDPDGHTLTAAYDANGNQTSETNADGNTTTATYNAFDEPTAITDPSGVTTSYAYNADGDLTSVSRPLTSNSTTQTTTYAYGSSAHPGDVTSITDPDGNTTTFTYDADGDLASSTDPTGDKTLYGYQCFSSASAGCYSGVGLLYTEVSPRGNVSGASEESFSTSYTYNALGEPLTVKNPLAHTTTYAYDLDGNQTSVTDSLGNATGYTYDADNELTKTTRPDGTTLTDGYDGDGNLTSQANAAGHTTSYAYNPLDRLVSITDPLNRVTTLGYDGTGNLTSVKDPLGRTTSYGYDAANQLTSVGYSDGVTPNVTYGYNADGERTSMTDGTGSTSYTYDSLDRLTGQTNGAGQAVSYGYDLDGNQTSIGYPNGKTVSQTFTKDDQLASVSDWLGNTTGFGYDPDSDLTAETFPSATADVDSYAYNNADQLLTTTFKQNTTTLASLTDTRNNDGQLASEAQTGLPGAASIADSYNKLSQLTAAGSNAYAYNTADDPTELDSSTGYSYDNAEELTKSPTASYSYDALGERTGMTPTSGTSAAYGYNQAGELSSYKPSTGASYSYAYDGSGLRATKTTGSTTQNFAYNLTTPTPLVLTDSTNSYIYGPGDLPIEQISASGTVSYLHHDQLGSTRLITNATGASAATFSYSPYGKPTSTGTATTPLGYAGQYTDSETGFQYDNARDYDPTTGQFLSVDPLALITSLPYAYGSDDPINERDPSGLYTVGLCVQAGFHVGPFALAGQLCGQASSSGQLGGSATGQVGVPSGGGAGVELGPTVEVSNAKNISQLEGPFVTGEAGAADVVGGYASGFLGCSSGQLIYGGQIGPVLGEGGFLSGGGSETEAGGVNVTSYGDRLLSYLRSL